MRRKNAGTSISGNGLVCAQRSFFSCRCQSLVLAQNARLKPYSRAFVAVHVNALPFFFIISLQEAWKAVIVMAAAGVWKRERKWENIKYINSMQTSFDAVVKGQSAATRTHGPRWKREIHASLYSRAHIQTYPFLFWLKIPSAYYETFYTYMYYELKTLYLTESEGKWRKNNPKCAGRYCTHTHKHFLSSFHALHLLLEFTLSKFPPSLPFLPFWAKVDCMYEFLRLYFE